MPGVAVALQAKAVEAIYALEQQEPQGKGPRGIRGVALFLFVSIMCQLDAPPPRWYCKRTVRPGGALCKPKFLCFFLFA